MTTLEFNTLLLQMREPLFYFSGRFYRSEDDRLDLVQDTMVKVLQNQDKFNAGTNFKAWVFTIMKNTFINQYKKVQRKKETISSDDLYENARTFVDYETPLSTYQKNEFEERIHQLDVKYCDPLKMYHEGWKYEEIAEKMSLPLGTVKNRIHTARNILVNHYK